LPGLAEPSVAHTCGADAYTVFESCAHSGLTVSELVATWPGGSPPCRDRVGLHP